MKERVSISAFAIDGMVVEVGLPQSMDMNPSVSQRETRKVQWIGLAQSR